MKQSTIFEKELEKKVKNKEDRKHFQSQYQANGIYSEDFMTKEGVTHVLREYLDDVSQ